MNDPSRLPKGILRAISREEMLNLPVRRYDGEVRLVATRDDVDGAWDDIGHERVVGFDTETRPSFRKGEIHFPCLVQIATARKVYLLRLGEPHVSEVVAALLSESGIVKAGVALADDLRALKNVFAFTQENMLDLGLVARRGGLGQTGVRNLAGILLGFRVAKGAKTSNWAAPRLSPAQITYAATDAWVCRELFLEFERLGLLAQRPRGRASDD